ncbi:MAG: hypothetical protein ABSH34_35295 [Verrucomicrobiota bacterium]|jgi:hypothetical protein
MTSNTQRITLVTLVFAAQLATGHGVSAAAVTNGVSTPSPETLRLVHGACAQTLTNIHADLLKLVRTFPVLDGMSNAHIVSAEPLVWRNTTWEHHRLSYHKNVRTEQLKPGPDGTDPQQAEIQTVERGGVRLEIYVVQRAVKIERAHEYALPYGAGDNQLRLLYNLKANPPDPALEKSVREVIEKHVELLKKNLQPK